MAWAEITAGAQRLQGQARALLARWDAERVRRLARLSRWAVRAFAWRERAARSLATLHTLLERIQAAFRLAYYVLPGALVHPRSRAARQRILPAPPRARIIANPAAGGLHGELGQHALRETAVWLATHGLPAEIRLTRAPGDATHLAREAVKDGMELVIAAGGDGTVNGVVQALAGSRTALGVLPLGTVNVWAREMGIPMDLAGAREVLTSGERRRMDLGRAGSRYFLLMAGIGFDAEVARRVDRGPLKRLGLKLLDYVATAGVLSVTQRPARVWMRYDGRRRSASALMVIIGNTRLYGGTLTFAKRAVADDGLLDIVIVENGGLVYRLGVLARAAVRRASLGPRVRYAQTRMIRLEASSPLPVQVDGEVIGTLPMTFSVAPATLTVVVPHGAKPGLFVCEPLSTPSASSIAE